MSDAEQTPDEVEPLTLPLEFTSKHDPYVNRAFLALFSHEENADLARAFTVGLPINDPTPEVVEAEGQEPEEDEEAEAEAAVGPSLVERRVAAYRDKDGDEVHFVHYPARDCVVVGINGAEAVFVPVAALEPFITLLISAADGDEVPA